MTQQQIKHWIDSEKNRKGFWATAKDLALEKDDVYTALGVESVHDFPGTSLEAIACLHKYADEVAGVEATIAEAQGSFEMPEGAELKHGTDEVFKACKELPEAPVLIWTKFTDRMGFKWSITLRAGLTGELATEALRSVMEQIVLFHKAAKHNQWLPEGTYIQQWDKPSQPAQSTSSNAPTPTSSVSAPPRTAEDGPVTGSNKLNAIKVDADGRVAFHVDGFRWPFKDSRGAETVIQVFDSSSGLWTADHLAPGSNHTGLNLVVDWERVTKMHGEQEKKYYNVLKVYVPEPPFE